MQDCAADGRCAHGALVRAGVFSEPACRQGLSPFHDLIHTIPRLLHYVKAGCRIVYTEICRQGAALSYNSLSIAGTDAFGISADMSICIEKCIPSF